MLQVRQSQIGGVVGHQRKSKADRRQDQQTPSLALTTILLGRLPPIMTMPRNLAARFTFSCLMIAV
jgi:hypothetical protein